jgi:hypothetical protein
LLSVSIPSLTKDEVGLDEMSQASSNKIMPALKPGELRAYMLFGDGDSINTADFSEENEPTITSVKPALSSPTKPSTPTKSSPSTDRKGTENAINSPSKGLHTASVPLKPVTAFSADTLWEANFLLAPSTNVEAFNQSFRTLNLTGDPSSELANYWRSLDKPPVLLLNSSPFTKRLEKAFQPDNPNIHAHTLQFADTVGLTSVPETGVMVGADEVIEEKIEKPFEPPLTEMKKSTNRNKVPIKRFKTSSSTPSIDKELLLKGTHNVLFYF